MKAGERYIIEIETVVDGIAKIKGFNTLVFDEFGLDKLNKIEDDAKILTPYDIETIKKTNYDLGYSEGYDEAKRGWYRTGYDDGKIKGFAQGYEDGKRDAYKEMNTESETHEKPQVGDIYKSKSDGSKIIVTYNDAGMSMVLLSNGDNSYYDAEELNKYYEFVENRADVLEPIKTALL